MPCIRTEVDEVVHLEQVYRALPPLSDIFEAWHSSRSRVSMHTLKLREQCLGVATLSSASLCLLYDIASRYMDDLHLRVCTHEASQGALETQAQACAACVGSENRYHGHGKKPVAVELRG